MSRIFLSYARDDVDAARQLAQGMAEAGHDVWWDRHLNAGARFASEIAGALKEARAVVVLWSEASVDSAWVQDEAAEGRDTGRLVPVTIGSAKPPLGFRQFHAIDLGSWDGRGHPNALDQLLDAIERICRSDAPGDKPIAAENAKTRANASICVLPFINMSGDPEQEYFSDGITEDIITDLSKVSALFVVARNTAFTFKGRVMDVQEVGQALEVSHVLEGSVRKVGSRVRITAQLIDAATGGHIWADRYDRDLTDIFAIQDEISKAIVAVLKVKLLPAEKRAIETRGTQSVEAYNLYLKARQQWTEGSLGDVRRQEAIVRMSKQALSFDPDYAQAWALVALAQSQLRFWHGMDVDPEPAAERALAINPDLAEAHCVKAQLLEEQGNKAEAMAEIESAVQLDPDSWEVNREAARLIFRQGRIGDSVPYFEKAAALMDSDWHNAFMLTTCYRETGDLERRRWAAQTTVDRAETAIARDPSNANVLAAGAGALAALGEDQRAKDWIERALLLDPDNNIMRYNLACALATDLNEPARAIEVLETYFRTTIGVTHVRHAEIDPDLDPLRDDPRFREMLAAAKKRLRMHGDHA